MRVAIALAAALTLAGGAAAAQEKFEHNEKGEWAYELKDGPVELKREQKVDQYKSEFKDGRLEIKRESKADGSWKEEVKDGPCEVKRERSADGKYKEERKCG
jgi:hypothetical protein